MGQPSRRRSRSSSTAAAAAKTPKATQEAPTTPINDAARRPSCTAWRSVRILDPACGSGNFLYVAIQQLLDLEKEVITFAARPDIALGLLPTRPARRNFTASRSTPTPPNCAQVVIWIGYLQWMRDNGFNVPRDPILEPLQTIENRDAILAWADEKGQPIPVWREGAKCLGPATWPEADFIIGNPPFLGAKLASGKLG